MHVDKDQGQHHLAARKSLGSREGSAPGQVQAGLLMYLWGNWPHMEQGQGWAVTGGQGEESPDSPPEAGEGTSVTRLWAPAGSCCTGPEASTQAESGSQADLPPSPLLPPQRETGASHLHLLVTPQANQKAQPRESLKFH